jgi:hypothetical protein
VKTQTGKGRWVDLAGLVTPQETIDNLFAEIENGTISSLDDVNAKLKEIYDNFQTYEWAWVANALEQDIAKPVDQFTAADVIAVIQNWIASVEKLDLMRCSDVGKEFSLASRIGFGVDGTEAERDADFEAVRGTAAENSFITELKERLERKKKTVAELIGKLQKFS